MIARGVLAGDGEAVEAFLARMGCVRRIVTLKNGQVGGPLASDELEDVVQEVLVNVWRRLGDYEGRGSLEAWSYRFCHFTFLARLRSYASSLEVGEASDVEVEPESRDADVDPWEQERVYRALDSVGPPDADVIRQKHLEGLTFEEIAERSGASINTTKSRYYRGLKKVRDELGLSPSDVEGELS